MTLAMAALAYLTLLCLHETKAPPAKKTETAVRASLEAGVALISLTVSEVRKLLWEWLWRHLLGIMHIADWSLW